MVSTVIDRTKGLVTHTGTGSLSVEEITKAFEARIENPDFRTGMKVLWDFSGATLSSLSTSGVRRLVGLNTKHADARGGGMSAIVVSRDVDYGICRMFETLAQDLPWRTTVFRDLESAMRCLGSAEPASPPRDSLTDYRPAGSWETEGWLWPLAERGLFRRHINACF